MKENYLRLCEVILHYNIIIEKVEALGVVVEPDFLDGLFYRNIDLVNKIIISYLKLDSSNDEELIYSELNKLNAENFAEVTEKIWNDFSIKN